MYGNVRSSYGWLSKRTENQAVLLETNGDPNVTALWFFDEASGNIVDEIASLSVTATGTPTYSINTSNYSPLAALGIRCSPGATQSAFVNAGAQAALNFGTSSGVIEIVAQFDDPVNPGVGGATDCGFVDTRNSNTDTGILIMATSVDLTTAGYSISIRATDGTEITYNLIDPHNGAAPFVGGGSICKKWRLVLDRSSNAQLIYNGQPFSSISMSTLVGKSIDSSRFTIGGRFDVFRPFDITFNTLRWTVGNATNNLGGPGGG